MNNFTTRTISASVFTIVMLACLLVNQFLFAAFFMVVMANMMREFHRMTMGDSFRLSRGFSVAAAAVLFFLIFFICLHRIPARFVSLALIPLIALMVSLLYAGKDESGVSSNIFAGFLYIAVPVSLISLVAFDDGSFDGMLLLCFFVIIWGSDVGAFLLGSTLGKKFNKKLCPNISPNKTWTGFWGGMALAVISALTLKWTGLLELPTVHCIILAILMDVAGVYGDLFESRWKRQCGVKDSGSIIPGHGGLLDRFDSALFAIPVGATYMALANLL